MIDHFSIRPSAISGISFLAPFGDGSDVFGPPTGADPDCWSDHAVLFDKISLHGSVAPGVGTSWDFVYVVGAATVGSTVSLSGTNTNVTGSTSATMAASASPVVGDSHSLRFTHTGTTANAVALNLAQLYQDQTDPTTSIFAWGNGADNMSYPGSPTFIGFDGEVFNSVEAVQQAVVPVAGSFFHFFARYITDGTTTYNVEVRVNGITIATIPIPSHTGTGAFVSANISVPVVAGNLVSFRINRTGGAGTGFIMYAQTFFQP